MVRRVRAGMRAAQGRVLFNEVDPGSVQPPPARKPECSTGKARWSHRRLAEQRLAEIVANEPLRMYTPSAVIPCNKCGGYHLTSNSQKQWAKGKSPRGLRRR